jgi:carboxyl-terminal processing protease
MMREASKYKKLILDLRGNGGGRVAIEEYLVGHFFDVDVKIGTMIMRRKSEERIARPQRERAFKGELIVLVDSNSASASEVFARVIQLEKRGKIVGDVTAGAVMTSYYFTEAGEKGTSAYYFYGLNVTIADLVMSDGNRLENVGVTPDRLVGPARTAWLEHSDPVLAYAAGLLGSQITPADAGKFRFFKSRFEDDEDDDSSDSPTDN